MTDIITAMVLIIDNQQALLETITELYYVFKDLVKNLQTFYFHFYVMVETSSSLEGAYHL